MWALGRLRERAPAGQVGAAAVQVSLHIMPEAALLVEGAAAAHKVEADAGFPAPATLLLALLRSERVNLKSEWAAQHPSTAG